MIVLLYLLEQLFFPNNFLLSSKKAVWLSNNIQVGVYSIVCCVGLPNGDGGCARAGFSLYTVDVQSCCAKKFSTALFIFQKKEERIEKKKRIDM